MGMILNQLDLISIGIGTYNKGIITLLVDIFIIDNFITDNFSLHISIFKHYIRLPIQKRNL